MVEEDNLQECLDGGNDGQVEDHDSEEQGPDQQKADAPLPLAPPAASGEQGLTMIAYSSVCNFLPNFCT